MAHYCCTVCGILYKQLYRISHIQKLCAAVYRTHKRNRPTQWKTDKTDRPGDARILKVRHNRGDFVVCVVDAFYDDVSILKQINSMIEKIRSSILSLHG